MATQSSKNTTNTKTIRTPPSSSPFKEEEENITFFGVLVRRKGNKLQTSVYQKPTHTNRYIQFSSHYHPRILRGVIQCIRDRAHNVCGGKSKPTELKHLNVFTANGFPKRLTEHTLRHHTTRNGLNPLNRIRHQSNKNFYFFLISEEGVKRLNTSASPGCQGDLQITRH